MLVTLFFASNIVLPLVDVISDILTAQEMFRFEPNENIRSVFPDLVTSLCFCVANLHSDRDQGIELGWRRF